MSRRNTSFVFSAIRLGIFAIVSLAVTGLLVSIMGGLGRGPQTEYQAVFASASELVAGDDVRVAGVIVGRVTDVEIHDRNQALVAFEVDEDVRLTSDTQANIRFLNLIGDRYMALTEEAADGQELDPDSTLPMERTTPALNLTELLNGFQPLFQALDPEEVNKLSLNLVRVLQGEGGTVQELLASTASLTETLADRDQLIGEVIDNLGTVTETVDSRREQLDELLRSMRAWFTDLAEDREIIGESIVSIADVSEKVADLLTESRPLLKADVAELRRLFTILAEPENKEYLDETLDKLPEMLSKQTRIGVYGSWYNYYLCEFQGGVVLPSALMDALPEQVQPYVSEFTLRSGVDRCQKEDD